MTDARGIGGRTETELSEGARAAAAQWDEAGRDWAELVAPVATPVWHVNLDAARVTRGTSVLDLGCGSGEALVLASLRGASPAGVDVSTGLLEVARERQPDADLRRGELEALPFDDDRFDAAISANTITYAADVGAALGEVRRVLRPGGRLAVSYWGADDRVEYVDVLARLYALADRDVPDRFFPLGEEGALEELLHGADFRVVESGTVAVPFVYPDRETFVRAQRATDTARRAIAAVGRDAVDEAVLDVAARFRRADGSYRIENEFRYAAGELA